MNRLDSLQFALACPTVLTSAACSCVPTAGAGAVPVSQACSAFAQAHCARLQSCSATRLATSYGDGASCQAALEQSCSDELAAPDTGNSAARTQACAQATGDWDCIDFVNGVNVPSSCAQVSGQLVNGQACTYSSQCQSSFCAIATYAACGVCAPLPFPGDRCANLSSCGDGMNCTTETQTCATPLQLGASCSRGHPCIASLTCLGVDNPAGASGTCVTTAATAGIECDPTRDTMSSCYREGGFACDPATLQCVAIDVVQPGQPCDGDVILCAAGGTCVASGDAGHLTCLAAAAPGESCGPGTLGPTPCAAPDHCVLPGDAPGELGVCLPLSEAACQ
jgi:hypothetical protein